MKYSFVSAIVVLMSMGTAVYSTEPNDSFATATILSAGVRTVSDTLTYPHPDTFLGIRDGVRQIYFVDNDTSPVGDGHASGAGHLPTNGSSIDFSITGFGDITFTGNHSEAGAYEVYVNVFDADADPIDSFSQVRVLAPGVVHDFTFHDSDWIGGSYNVYIDNVRALNSDVDFFTFTQLSPGTQFLARTADPTGSNVDTFMGWFGGQGVLKETDNNGAGGNLSQIDGIVPDNGKLTFAVTGIGDYGFNGSHLQAGSYELRLEILPPVLQGDYNKNNVVDSADYTVWRKSLNQSGSNLPADGNGDGTIDADDYGVWRAHFGQTAGNASGSGADAAVPEPATLVLLLFASAGCCNRRK